MKNRVLTGAVSLFLVMGLLLAPITSLKTYAVSEEIQAILNAKDQQEKNALILEEVAKAQAMPIQSNEYTNWPEGPVVDAPAAILMDVDTGTILYAKNIDDQHYPASITKIMTCLLAMEHGEREQEVVFSHNAIYDVEPGSASAGMKEGEKVSLDVCLRLVMSQSANECAYAAAETVGGDFDTFIQMMNDKAEELGCEGAHFVNPNGLFDEDHHVSAYGMAKIAAAAYQYDWFRELCNIPNYKRPLTEMNPKDEWAIKNRHQMLHPDNDYYYEGITGGKTGFTDEARNTLVTFAERDGMRLVCVVMQTEGVRVYGATRALFDYGFQNFERIPLEQFMDASVITNVRKGGGATVPKGSGTGEVFAAISLDTDGLPAGVTSNVVRADFQYHGRTVGSAEVIVRPSYAASLTPQKEEPEATIREEAEAQAEEKGHINPWIFVIGGVFLFALILLITASVKLSKIRKRSKARKTEKDKKSKAEKE